MRVTLLAIVVALLVLYGLSRTQLGARLFLQLKGSVNAT
jgi:hypothetical protein